MVRSRVEKSTRLKTINALGKIATLPTWEPIPLNCGTPHGFAGQFGK
jgi:hypothetical protein